MRIKIFLTFVFFLFIMPAIAQDSLGDAPVTPEFLKYNSLKQASILKDFSPDGHSIGLVPVPVQLNCKIPISGTKNMEIFPLKCDLRDSGWVTPVKNQLNCGGCWNFVAMAALESNWLKRGLDTFDLSEQNLRTCHGFVTSNLGSCTGGNHLMVSAYLSRRAGPVLESEDPYRPVPTDTCNNSFAPVAFADEIRFLPNNMNTVKQAILNYGGIYISMYWDNSAYNLNTHNYKYSGDSIVNHAVMLVGWDDTRSISGKTGAWIAKNSWGTSWGEHGFFYISYYDTKALSDIACFPTRLDYNNDETLYMYDKLGMVANTGYKSSVAYALVKYTATGKQEIKKLGTYCSTAGSTIDFSVYYDKQGDKLVNLLDSMNGKYCPYPGYYTFDLPHPVKLNPGDNYYIKVRYYTPGYGYPIPVEKYLENYADPVIETGVGWISGTGEIWTAIGSNIPDQKKDLCIRAYTLPDTSITTTSDPPVVKLYPNPCDKYLNILFTNAGSRYLKIEIFNILGKLVYLEEVNAPDATTGTTTTYSNYIKRLDISKIEKGLYFIRISGSGLGTTEKFIFE